MFRLEAFAGLFPMWFSQRPAKMSGTPENKRDDPELPKGGIPMVSAGFIDYLGEQEKNKWCQKRDRDVPTKRYMTTLYCDFSARDTVQNTVLASALVLNEDSNRCGRVNRAISKAPELFRSFLRAAFGKSMI